MKDNIFVAIDVETTGFSPINNELIEISAIKYKDGKKIDTFSTLIKPKDGIPYHITRITGINNSMVQNSPYIEEVVDELVDFVGDAEIVAHNANFDMKFLNQNTNNSFISNRVVDTVQISKIIAPDLPNYKLGTVARHIGIEEDGFHRAEFDCECCAQIYIEYLKMNQNQVV